MCLLVVDELFIHLICHCCYVRVPLQNTSNLVQLRASEYFASGVMWGVNKHDLGFRGNCGLQCRHVQLPLLGFFVELDWYCVAPSTSHLYRSGIAAINRYLDEVRKFKSHSFYFAKLCIFIFQSQYQGNNVITNVKVLIAEYC